MALFSYVIVTELIHSMLLIDFIKIYIRVRDASSSHVIFLAAFVLYARSAGGTIKKWFFPQSRNDAQDKTAMK